MQHERPTVISTQSGRRGRGGGGGGGRGRGGRAQVLPRLAATARSNGQKVSHSNGKADHSTKQNPTAAAKKIRGSANQHPIITKQKRSARGKFSIPNSFI